MNNQLTLNFQSEQVAPPDAYTLLDAGLRVIVEDNPCPAVIEKFCMELGGKNDRYKCYYVKYDNGNRGIVNEDKIKHYG